MSTIRNYREIQQLNARLHMADSAPKGWLSNVSWQTRANLIVLVGCVIAVALSWWLA